MLKILHLDDEIDIGQVFCDLFSSDKISIQSFTEVDQALESLRKDPPDLIFLDYRLPGITGEDVALKMNTQIPICLISGDMSLKTQYPFAAKFKKPWNTEEIQAFLDSFPAQK